jgi:serine/threonine-protein phosphatase 5
MASDDSSHFAAMFKTLPLAAHVQPSTLICHGGLWRSPAPRAVKKGKKRKRTPPLARASAEALAPDGDPAWQPAESLLSLPSSNGSACSCELGTLAQLKAAYKGGMEPSDSEVKKNQIPSDVLWSDPVPDSGFAVNESRGGVGMVFGPDVTAKFLQREGLRLIVRSHEGPDARRDRTDVTPLTTGFSLDHDTEHGAPATL